MKFSILIHGFLFMNRQIFGKILVFVDSFQRYTIEVNGKLNLLLIYI